MPPVSTESGSVELAIATRRGVFDPRRRLMLRRALGWSFVGLGTAAICAAMFLTVSGGALSPIFVLITGGVAAAIGLGRVDRALAELRRYDHHVKPLPAAKLRLRSPRS